MAAQTIFNWILTWADGDTPGAGSQSADSSGTNGQFWKIGEKMDAIFSLPTSSLKSAIIGAAQLKTTVCDGVTVQLNGTTNKIEVKDPTSKIPAGGLATATLADRAVTPVKTSHDNKRTKHVYGPYIWNAATVDTASYCTLANVTNLITAPVQRAGCVTGVAIQALGGGGVVQTFTWAYNEAGTGYCAVGDKIGLYTGDGVNYYIRINGVNKLTIATGSGYAGPLVGFIEYENAD
jgi:hypothetical protein